MRLKNFITPPSLGAVGVVVGVGLVFFLTTLTPFTTGSTTRIAFPPNDPTPNKFHLKPRISIPSSVAKSYWISGTFFNNGNFKGLPMSFYSTGPKCTLLLPSFKKSIKSPSTTSNGSPSCVMLFKDKKCQGPYFMAVNVEDMGEIDMGQVNSMKMCPPLDDSWKYNIPSPPPLLQRMEGEVEG